MLLCQGQRTTRRPAHDPFANIARWCAEISAIWYADNAILSLAHVERSRIGSEGLSNIFNHAFYRSRRRGGGVFSP